MAIFTRKVRSPAPGRQRTAQGDRAPTASPPLDLRLIDLLPRHSSSRHKGGIGAHRPDERSREQPQR